MATKRKQRPFNGERWKSIIVPRAMYNELKVITELEGRTLTGQLRMIFTSWKDDNLSKQDLGLIYQKVEEKQAAEVEARLAKQGDRAP